MEIPEISDINKEGLVDWDQFNYKGPVNLFVLDKILIGGDVGFKGLYR